MRITILHPYSTNFFAFNFSSYAGQAEFFFCLDQPIHLSHPTPSSSKPTIFPTTFQTSTESYIIFYHSLLTIYSNSPTYLTKYKDKADICKRKIMPISSFCLLLLNNFISMNIIHFITIFKHGKLFCLYT